MVARLPDGSYWLNIARPDVAATAAAVEKRLTMSAHEAWHKRWLHSHKEAISKILGAPQGKKEEEECRCDECPLISGKRSAHTGVKPVTDIVLGTVHRYIGPITVRNIQVRHDGPG